MSKEKSVILGGAAIVVAWSIIENGVPIGQVNKQYPFDFMNAGEGKNRKSIEELALDAVKTAIGDRVTVAAEYNGNSSSPEKTASVSTTKKSSATKKRRGRPPGTKNRVVEVS